MKKCTIVTTILLIAIGFATVATNLYMYGSTTIMGNQDAFEGDVYFSKATSNTGGTATIDATTKKTITYRTSELSLVGDTSKLDFTVTNDSTMYDATVSISCVIDETSTYKEYFTVTPDASSYDVDALSSKDGYITVALTKASVEDAEVTFTCTLTANADERDTVAEAGKKFVFTDSYEDGKVGIGDVLTLENENFNIISLTDSSIKMLSQYCLGTNYRQTSSNDFFYGPFSNESGWNYTPGPNEIDVQIWSTNPKNYLNNYLTYIQSMTKDLNITADLITVKEMKQLGCTGINDDYTLTRTNNSMPVNPVCTSSEHSKWLINGQPWWTRSSTPDFSMQIYYVQADGYMTTSYYWGNMCVRPVITISKDTIESL